jgi:hypothetical protein
LGLLAVLLSAAAPAQAHDPPEVTHIEWMDTHRALFGTARGFILGDTDARSYRWACIEGVGLQLGEQPSFIVLPDDSWLVATEHGLKRSSDQGCSWSSVARFGVTTASALVAVPGDAGHVLLALAGAAVGGVYESRDAGGTWQKRLNLAADDYVAQIGVAATDTSRIYLSGLVIDEAADKFSFQLTRSRDGGTSWDRAYVPLAPDEDRAVLAAVSPTDPDALVVLANNHRWGEAPDRALYSTDAGSTFRELARGIKLTAAAFDITGEHVILAGGDSLSRVYLGADSEEAPQKIGESQLLSCAQSGPDALYACGHVGKFDPVNAGAFVSGDDGVSWRSLMAFTEVKQAVQCTDQAAAKQCKDQWIDWQLEILVGLGGAPIDSVEGWQDGSFKGIEETPAPAPAHTLATAKRTEAAAAPSGGDAAVSSMDPTRDVTNAGGCQTALTMRTQPDVWGFFTVLCCGIALRLHTKKTGLNRFKR